MKIVANKANANFFIAFKFWFAKVKFFMDESLWSFAGVTSFFIPSRRIEQRKVCVNLKV